MNLRVFSLFSILCFFSVNASDRLAYFTGYDDEGYRVYDWYMSSVDEYNRIIEQEVSPEGSKKRYRHGCVPLEDGRVYIVSDVYVLLFNPDLNCWERYPRMAFYFDYFRRSRPGYDILKKHIPLIVDEMNYKSLLNTRSVEPEFYLQSALTAAIGCVNLYAVEELLKQPGLDLKIRTRDGLTLLQYCDSLIEKKNVKDNKVLKQELKDIKKALQERIREFKNYDK